MTLVYVIGGASCGDASALMNFEYYAKYGMYEKDEKSDLYEIGRVLNDRVLLISDGVVEMNEQLNQRIKAVVVPKAAK